MISDKKGYNILVIEDNPGDFALVEDFLFEQIESPVVVSAKSFKEAQIILSDEHKLDIVLLDLSLPDMTGEPLIKGIVNLCPITPIIVLTGYADFNFGIKSISLGISDYILKDELTPLSLYKSIIYSSERKKISFDLEESEKKYSELFHSNPLPMWVFDIETLQFLNVNNAAVKYYGYTSDEFLSMTIRDIRQAEELPVMEKSLRDFNEKNKTSLKGIFKHKKKNGEIIQVDVQSNLIIYKGRKAIVILANDVTERLKYINAIEEQNEKLREISWIQSHVVRAPLARIMGLVPLIKDTEMNEEDRMTMLEYLSISANELDELIKHITDKTRMADYQ